MQKNRDCNAQPFRPRRWRNWPALASAVAALLLAFSGWLVARPSLSIDEVLRGFESHYNGVRTLQADFTQTYYAWGRTRVESGSVYLALGGRMRWAYQQPEEKLFVSNGKQVFFYVPSEKQVTISRAAGEARVPLDLLLSHVQLSKVFSRVKLDPKALEKVETGDSVIRGYPRLLYKRDYRSVLIELTPQFDVRRLVVFYPDNSTMQFAFSKIERNKPLDSSLFLFSPPAGTEIIHQ